MLNERIPPLIEKLRIQHAEIETQLSDPAVISDRVKFLECSREYQRLSTLFTAFDGAATFQVELDDSKSLLGEDPDPDLEGLLHEEISRLEIDIARLEQQVLSMILPPLENEDRSTIVEIRPAAGGSEAALFAGDLMRMYERYAEKRKWRTESLSITTTDLGGIKDVVLSIEGDDVFRVMRFESGVHRVQRVPTTEASGRIHTSTVTVAVLPEAEEVDVEILPDDIEMEAFRSSGPGGQHVNTTDSAVRLTHIPSGLSVVSQKERSQHRNREIAMRLLRSRLLEQKQREEDAKMAATRRAQVGTGDRSERIRTYNFPQNRVTDHRYGLSWHRLSVFLEGELDEMFEVLLATDAVRRLDEGLEHA